MNVFKDGEHLDVSIHPFQIIGDREQYEAPGLREPAALHFEMNATSAGQGGRTMQRVLQSVRAAEG